MIPSLHNFDSVDKNKTLLCLLGTVRCYFKKIQWLRLDCRHLCVFIVCVKVNQITIPLDSRMFLVEHIVSVSNQDCRAARFSVLEHSIVVWQLFRENFIVSQVLHVRHGDPLNSCCFLLQKYQPQFDGILLQWTFGGTSLGCVLYLDTKHLCIGDLSCQVIRKHKLCCNHSYSSFSHNHHNHRWLRSQ